MTRPQSTSLLIVLVVVCQNIQAQKCVPAKEGLTITEQAVRSPIVIKAKVQSSSRENHTAIVTFIFPTRNGGLKVNDNIVFGPVKRGKGCPRIRKNSEYLLFLKEASTSEPQYHRIEFDPVSKLSQAKKLKKILCEGCVKPPKISGKNKVITLKENGSFTFKCKAVGNPKPMAAYFKDGTKLPKKVPGMKIKIKKKGGGGRLIISKVKMEHAGVYTCEAENFAGNASLSYTLTVLKDDCVQCPPEKAGYCVHGRCCLISVVNETACRCEERYMGPRCEEKTLPVLPRNTITTIEARYHQQTIAIMAVCIALLLIILICYIVYCKFKKSRSHIRKEIIARNGSANGTHSVLPDHARAISDANPAGIVAADTASRAIPMTGYRSTNLADQQPPQPFNAPSQPFAFAQRPQTYDDVILTQTAAESQPLMQPNPEQLRYSSRHDSRHSRSDANGKRRRKNGVAVEHAGDQSHSASENDMPKSRRIDDLKSKRDSMTSSASSIGSHPELRKPALPLDERLAHMAMRGVYRPPDYPSGENDDVPDSEPMLHVHAPFIHQESQHSAASGSVSPPQSPVAPSISSSNSAHRVTTFDAEGGVEEESLGRDEKALQSISPHSHSLSSGSPLSNLPKPYSPPASPGTDSGHVSPRKLPYQKENVGGNVYPYYEHNPQQLGSPKHRHDSDEIFSGMEIPDTSLYMYDPQRRSQPSSPRQYQTSPDMSMGMPYHHAPVTVASARTHHLPLLTKENPELSPVDTDTKMHGGSTVSLSSSSSNTSSPSTQHNRNSHKIEV